MGEKLPPFASGKINKNYDLLFEYWRVAREKGREDLVEMAMLNEKDYKLLKEIALKDRNLNNIIQELVEVFLKRLDEGIAGEAAKRKGWSIPPSTAKMMIAKLLAFWLVEAGEYWGVLRIPSLNG